jgi:hypothetical protein
MPAGGQVVIREENGLPNVLSVNLSMWNTSSKIIVLTVLLHLLKVVPFIQSHKFYSDMNSVRHVEDHFS